MRLALNTFVYEVGKWPIEKTLKSAAKLGFRRVEHAGYHSGDPCLMSKARRRDVTKMYKDLGLRCSQLLLANTQNIASSRPGHQRKTLAYMQRCAEFALALGGRQVLICWGCGVHEAGMLPEQAWVNMTNMLRKYAAWGLDKGILVDLELDPHVYFVVNSLDKMARAIEDAGLPNVYPNVDIGHLCITREGPERLEKIRHRIIHIHISETDTFEHTNSIIGTGKANFKGYITKCMELGIERNCRRIGEEAIAGIEMGEPGGKVDDPERWVRESLQYLGKLMPNLRK